MEYTIISRRWLVYLADYAMQDLKKSTLGTKDTSRASWYLFIIS
jgi:hypothetical protein